MTLDQLKAGSSAVIRSVGGQDELRLRLLDMGLIPRTAVTMRKAAPMGDPLEIHVRGYELTLRVADAKKIVMESEDDDDGIGPCGKPELRKDDLVQRPHRGEPARWELSRRHRGSKKRGHPRGEGLHGR